MVRVLSWALAITFACGLVFHVAAALVPSMAGTSSPARHGVFVLINGLFAAAFAVRWRYVIVPAALLAVQQTRSHGADFLEARARGEWDVMSLGVLVMLPIMLGVAWALKRPSRTPP